MLLQACVHDILKLKKSVQILKGSVVIMSEESVPCSGTLWPAIDSHAAQAPAASPHRTLSAVAGTPAAASAAVAVSAAPPSAGAVRVAKQAEGAAAVVHRLDQQGSLHALAQGSTLACRLARPGMRITLIAGRPGMRVTLFAGRAGMRSSRAPCACATTPQQTARTSKRAAAAAAATHQAPGKCSPPLPPPAAAAPHRCRQGLTVEASGRALIKLALIKHGHMHMRQR